MDALTQMMIRKAMQSGLMVNSPGLQAPGRVQSFQQPPMGADPDSMMASSGPGPAPMQPTPQPGGMPGGAAPSAGPMMQPQPVQSPSKQTPNSAVLAQPAREPGHVKKMLMDFMYGGAQSLKKMAGMPTDAEEQQQQLENRLKMQDQQQRGEYQQAQMANMQTDNARQMQEGQARMAEAEAARRNAHRDAYTDLVNAGIPPERAIRLSKPDSSTSQWESYLQMAGGDPRKARDMQMEDQKAIAAAGKSGAAPVGSLQLHETSDGRTVLFNNKTGEIRDAKGILTTGQAKDVNKAYGDVQDSQSRYNKMQEDYKQIAKNPANAGSFDMDLLSNHIAMTFGNVKGARTGRDLIEAHIAARALPENLVVAYNHLKNGGTLSDAQRQNFIHLAQTTLGEAQRKHKAIKSLYSGDDNGDSSTPGAGGGWGDFLKKSKPIGAR